jgi:hypothetical protein
MTVNHEAMLQTPTARLEEFGHWSVGGQNAPTQKYF